MINMSHLTQTWFRILPQMCILLAPPPAVPDPHPGASPLWSGFQIKLAPRVQRVGLELFWMVRRKKNASAAENSNTLCGISKADGKIRNVPSLRREDSGSPSGSSSVATLRGDAVKKKIKTIKTAAAIFLFSVSRRPDSQGVSVSWVKPL